jgi:hypothetical protein
MGNYVAVGIQCDGNTGVPEDLLEDLRVLTRLQPKRREGMPEIVESNVRKTSALEERLEVSRGQVVAVHRSAVHRWEDEVLVPGLNSPGGVPDLRVAQALFKITNAVGPEGLDGFGQEVDGTTLAGLGGVAQVGFAANEGNGAADASLPGDVGLLWEDEIGLFEAKEFARTRAGEDSQYEECLKSALGSCCGLKEIGDLFEGEGWHLLFGAARRGLGVASYIVGDESLLYGSLERHPDGGVNVTDGAGALASGSFAGEGAG